MDNPAIGFRIGKADLSFVGSGLSRPECILALPDGTFFTSHSLGILKIAPDGTQQLIERNAEHDADGGFVSIPNGIALMQNGEFLVANLGNHLIERVAPDGKTLVERDSIDGRPLGEVNFVMRDSVDGYWATIATYQEDSFAAYNGGGVADGIVIRVDSKGARIAAQGIAYANEIRLDSKREYLYVVESFGCCIKRFRLDADDVGKDGEVFGPADLGGIPDGIAFDSFGNLWVTLIGADRLGFITPDGDFHVVLEFGLPERVTAFQIAMRERRVAFSDLIAASDDDIRILTSVTFGGPDLGTIYLGSVLGERLPCFRAPCPGLPMAHWR
jgi:sugar lactone lactonase YvrE